MSAKNRLVAGRSAFQWQPAPFSPKRQDVSNLNGEGLFSPGGGQQSKLSFWKADQTPGQPKLSCYLKFSWPRGRYWVRTSDLFRVKEARYHCANRPQGLSCHRITRSLGLPSQHSALEVCVSFQISARVWCHTVMCACGCGAVVAHHLAKVRVASSNLVIRSVKPRGGGSHAVVVWPRGEAAACKAVYTGSNPVATSAGN